MEAELDVGSGLEELQAAVTDQPIARALEDPPLAEPVPLLVLDQAAEPVTAAFQGAGTAGHEPHHLGIAEDDVDRVQILLGQRPDRQPLGLERKQDQY
jgi:hypothetical protein